MFGQLDAVRGALRSCLPWFYRAALLTLVVWIWQHCLRAVWPFTIDDAGISYAYAKHIAEGRGPVAVVGGPWVEGYSNALWVFLLVPFQWLGFDLPVVAKLLGVLALASAALFGACALAAVSDERWSGWGSLQALLAIALGCSVESVVWAVAGLENSLFWALLLGLAYLDTLESRQANARGLSGLLAFALCITRPEGPLYVVAWLALQLVQALRDARARRRALHAVLLFLGPLLLYHALHYVTFGDWVPNTFLAKTTRWKWSDGYEYLALSLRESHLAYLLPLVALGLVENLRLKLLLAWYCVAGVAFVLYAGGDWMPHGRFLSLFLPAVLVLAAAGVDNASRALVWATRRRVPRELVCLALGACSSWFWWNEQAPRLAQMARRPWCHFCERLAVTQAVQRLSRKGRLAHSSLLTQDFGGPAWLSSLQFQPIDFLGLCDRNVALLRQDIVAHRAGHLKDDFRFYQYLFHEQPQPPTWLSLPPNFWPLLDRSQEYRLDYFRMDGRLLPHTRGPYFALHRGELVDYFPPVPAAEFRPLASNLALIGARSFAPPSEARVVSVESGAPVMTLVSVVPRTRLSGEEQLELSIEAGGERVRVGPVPLSRGMGDIPYQLGRGEPLSVEFMFELPRVKAATYVVRLGVSQRAEVRAGAEPTWLELEPLRAGDPLVAYQRPLPRYPAALPPPIEPELRALRPALTLAMEQRHHFGLSLPADAGLVRQLLELGASYDVRGLASQAYLADVWATQLDPRAWERLSDTIFRLRQTAMDDEHALEIVLLQRYYEGGAPALAWLVAFYLSVQRLDEARYFAAFRPAPGADAELWSSLDRALESLARAGTAPAAAEALGLVARDPLEGAFDFEAPSLEGWEGDTAVYRAGARPNDRNLTGLRGQHGQGVLSSDCPDDSGRGTLLSPRFVLRGRMLSLLVGGGSRKQRVGVELMVDDTVVQATFGIESDFMFPALWDVSAYQGKTARLRVFDGSKDAHVLVDRILLWN